MTSLPGIDTLGVTRVGNWSAGPFALLRQHRAIAWDFDYTLNGHPVSPVLHAFILAHPHIRHMVVTFRTHGAQHDVWGLLAAYPDAPRAACFAGVLNISDEAHVEFHEAARRREMLPHDGPLTPGEINYLEWKGSACAQHGLTVLVDDMTEHVRRGCEKHGIALLHPDQFI